MENRDKNLIIWPIFVDHDAMKKLVLTVSVMALLLSGCDFKGENKDLVVGNGLRLTTTRPYSSGFDKLVLKNSYDGTVELQKSSEFTVKADANILEHVKSSVSNGVLTVNNAKELLPTNDIEVSIRTGQLKEISLNFASEIRVLSISADALTVNLSDAAKLTLSGQVNQLTVVASGTTNLDATGLTAQKVSLTQTGKSVAKVYAMTEVLANLQAESLAEIFGNPPKVEQNVASTAKLIHETAI